MNCTCVNDIFKKYDYNNIPIRQKLLKYHDTRENAWIAIGESIYSIQKDDILLLDIFQNLYGTDVKNFIMNNSAFNNKNRIVLLEKLKPRKIGFLLEEYLD